MNKFWGTEVDYAFFGSLQGGKQDGILYLFPHEPLPPTPSSFLDVSNPPGLTVY